MIKITLRRQKFKNQNWRYGHRNNHFGLKGDFCGLFKIFFQGPSQFSGYFRDLSRGINHFRVFSGFSGVAGHPAWAFLAIIWEPDFFQAYSFHRSIPDHKYLFFTLLKYKTNDKNFTKSPNTLFWGQFKPFFVIFDQWECF